MMDHIGTLLQANGFGTKGVDLFGGTMPAKPDNVISIYEHPGFEPERAMGRRVVDVMNLQILVRNVTSAAGQTEAYGVYDLLDMFVGVIEGVQYYSIMARQTPFSLGSDENNRVKWSCNYVVNKEPS